MATAGKFELVVQQSSSHLQRAKPSPAAANTLCWTASATNPIETLQFTVLETLACFEVGEEGTPWVINLDRVFLPLEEALSPLSLNFYLMENKLKPLMDFAVGANAQVAVGFEVRDAEAEVARPHVDASLDNYCLAAYREITRLVLLVDVQSLRLLPTRSHLCRPFPSPPTPGS